MLHVKRCRCVAHQVKLGIAIWPPKSRRTLESSRSCAWMCFGSIASCKVPFARRAGARWHDHNLVFASAVGTQLDAANVRRAFRKVATIAGLDAEEWTPQELRHSFVSLMSDAGVPTEKIALLAGHSSTATTERIYRKQIRAVVQGGAEVMDELFPEQDDPEA